MNSEECKHENIQEGAQLLARSQKCKDCGKTWYWRDYEHTMPGLDTSKGDIFTGQAA
jgi:hypothetical protein